MADLSSILDPEIDPDVPALLDELINAQLELKRAEHRVEVLKSHLTLLHHDGLAADNFQHSGCLIFLSPGRKVYSFSAQIQQEEEELKTHKETEIALGLATAKLGQPYWTIRADKGGSPG